MLDIAFIDEKIYVEYDGSGHDLSVKLGDVTRDEFIQKEINRYYFLNNLGWRLIRVISFDDFLPSDEIIKKYFYSSIEYLNEGHSWIKINFSENTIECSREDKVII